MAQALAWDGDQGRRKGFLLAVMNMVYIRGPGSLVRNLLKVGD